MQNKCPELLAVALNCYLILNNNKQTQVSQNIKFNINPDEIFTIEVVL